MDTKIPEIEARNILSGYTGANNQLLEWQMKLLNAKSFKITRPQADYILKYHQTVPKVARKYINLVISFGEKLQEEKLLTKPVEKIWCEKLLCESEKAYHIWGRMFDSQSLHAFWLPKGAVLQPEKKLNRVIDYSKYSHRPPKEWQPRAIEALLANDKFILADDMGLGKTTSAIIASLECEAKKILIVCPASVKINWKKEIENYSKDRVLIVEGRKWGSTFKYYIINYDILKNYHSTDKKEESEEFKLIVNEKFDLAIVDEAHYISNTTANRTKLLNDILEVIPKVWLLTGTPMTSRPINYFNLLKIVDSPVALNWQHYVKRYCRGFKMKVRSGDTTRTVWNTSGATNLDELRERTKNILLRRMKTEVPGLPEKIISPIYLELKSTYYNEELEEFMRITEENKHRTTLNVETQQEEPDRENVVAVLGRLMKVRQVLAFEKIQYTSELIDKCLELDKKVIVFSNFSMPIDMLREKYSKNSIILVGGMSGTKREDAIKRFQTDPKVKILIAQIIAGGIGINLTAAEVVIMNDLSFVPAHHSQAEDRAYRTGQVNNVLVYYPIFENTIEQIVYNILQRKKGIIDQVMGDGEYSVGFGKELIKELL